MENEVCCVNTKVIIDYIRTHKPDELDGLVEGLDPEIDGLEDPLAFLTDANNWVSSSVVTRMMEHARRIMRDDDAPFSIGFDSVKMAGLGYMQRILLKTLGTPKRTLKRVQDLNEKFNRTKVVELSHIESSQAVVRLHWFPGLDITKDVCRYNQGIYAAIPIVWGLPPAQVTETKCFFSGDQYCEFHLKWSRLSRLRLLKDLFFSRRAILKNVLQEMENDKALLQKTYAEVHRLNVQLQKKVRQLVSLRDASRAVTSILEIDRVLENVMSLLVHVLGFDRVILMLVDSERGRLKYAHAVGAPGELIDQISGYEVPLDRMSNVLARVAATGNVVLIRDVEESGLNQNNLILSLVRPKSFVIVPLISRNRVIGVLGADKTGGQEVTEEDKDCLVDFSNEIAIAIENAQLYEHLNISYVSSVQALARALEAKDSYTRGHSSRVAEYTVRVGEEMGLSARDIDQMRQACLLHDIGKIGVTESLLHKRGALTPKEKEEFDQHPIIGEEILKPLPFIGDQTAIIRNHHEWYDGHGYPDQLSGDRIPLDVRIVAVADAFDAMTSQRAYRPALPHRQAVLELQRHANTQFDPFVVSAFIDILSRQGAQKPTELAIPGGGHESA